ncbi:ribose 5-phosphate isomerase B [Thermodesulfovibrio sp. 3462-1]|uniref:Ribose 5-phosphate isomerase B n=1 Tax=Thermodesulfovibrio obliviosus TaxID=3118332 RepID=A0AAU8H7M7_9BACT
MKIAMATDHAAFSLKERIKHYLNNLEHEVIDFGCYSEESADYPLFISKAARAVANGQCERGIVMCGSGIGASIVANKIKGIRCALVYTPELCRLARQHNDANIIALAGRFTEEDTAKRIVDVFLLTKFEGGRHLGRVNQIIEIEEGRL